jgi:hypothetical protein
VTNYVGRKGGLDSMRLKYNLLSLYSGNVYTAESLYRKRAPELFNTHLVGIKKSYIRDSCY